MRTRSFSFLRAALAFARVTYCREHIDFPSPRQIVSMRDISRLRLLNEPATSIGTHESACGFELHA